MKTEIESTTPAANTNQMTANIKLGIGMLVMILAYAMLVPGLTEPVIHVVTTLDKSELATMGKEAILTSNTIPNFLMPMAMEVLNQVQVEGKVVVNDTAKSILGTAQHLWQNGNALVAFLIVFFSVVIPAIKLALLFIATIFKQTKLAIWLTQFSSIISKWSMSDVYVMAILISFLAINASTSHSNLVTTEINLENGFYFFLAYCLLSILASQVLTGSTPTNTKQK